MKPSFPFPLRARRARGVTLLEVMIAVTLMAIVSIVVMQVFSTGSSTYKFGNRDAVVLQRARYVFDTLERDIKCVYYMDEDLYNERIREQLEAYQQALLQLENGEITDADFEKMYGGGEEGEEGEVGNPFEKGRLIDLQFFGEDGGETDKMTFATRTSMRLGDPYSLWGLSRIHYTVDGDFLIRTRETVEANPRDGSGASLQVVEKAIKPEHSIIAPGIESFDLAFGWWSDNQWFESKSWTSNTRSFRNSGNLMGEYDEEDLSRIGEGGEGEGEAQQGEEDQQYDGLPSYVRARIVLTDPENPARRTEMSRIFRIPTALETWTINENLEEEEQDMEKEVRIAEFTPVFPGALRKQ